MKTFKYLALALVLVFGVIGLRAENWNTGTLLTYNSHQDIWMDQGTSKPAGVSCYLEVDVGDQILFVTHHVGYVWEHLPQLTEDGTIRWRMEKGKFVYLDDAGRKFKAYIAKTRMK